MRVHRKKEYETKNINLVNRSASLSLSLKEEKKKKHVVYTP